MADILLAQTVDQQDIMLLIFTSVGVSVYSFILSTDTMFVSTSLVMRTIQFSELVTCGDEDNSNTSAPHTHTPFYWLVLGDAVTD